MYLKFLVLKRGKILLHFSVTWSEHWSVRAQNRFPNSQQAGVTGQHWKLKSGFYRWWFGKRKGEIICSCDQGESLKMVLHTSFPSAISCQESQFEPMQLCILNTSRKCTPLWKGKHLAEIKSLVHTIKWTRCTKISNSYVWLLNMHLIFFISRFRYTLPSRCVL